MQNLAFKKSNNKNAARPADSSRSACKKPKQSTRGAKTGEPMTVLPHKFKTQMCRNFANGLTCPFGKNCNYAHGEEQLKKFSSYAFDAASSDCASQESRPHQEPESQSSLSTNLDWAKLLNATDQGSAAKSVISTQASSENLNTSRLSAAFDEVILQGQQLADSSKPLQRLIQCEARPEAEGRQLRLRRSEERPQLMPQPLLTRDVSCAGS